MACCRENFTVTFTLHSSGNNKNVSSFFLLAEINLNQAGKEWENTI
jgi:hypothetical protein